MLVEYAQSTEGFSMQILEREKVLQGSALKKCRSAQKCFRQKKIRQRATELLKGISEGVVL